MAVEWTDVCAHPSGGFIRAVSRDGRVDLDWILGGPWSASIPIPTDFLRFTRLDVSFGGLLGLCGQGGGGEGFVWQGAWRDIGVAYGLNGIAVRWAGDVLHTWRCVAPPPDGVPIAIDGVIATEPTWSNQGIREILDDGSIMLCKDTRERVLHGKNFDQWTEKLGLVVGQSGNGIRAMVVATGQTWMVRLGTINEGIHFDVAADGTLAVVATTEAGAFVEAFTFPYPFEQPIPPQDIPVIGHPCWLGFFNFVPVTTTPGNAWLSTADGLVRAYDTGQPFAVYAQAEEHGSTPEALAAAIAAARAAHPGLSVAAYWPWTVQGGPPPLSADWQLVEAYRHAGEALAAFEARVRAAVAKCPRPALACQCYTSNGGNTTDLASLVPVYAAIARDVPSLTLLLAFSGEGRPTGLNDHPEVRPLWDELARGIPSHPPTGGIVPDMGITDEQFAYLEQCRRAYGPRVSVTDIGAILNKLAWQFRRETGTFPYLGLQDKPGGTAAVMPDGRSIWNGIRGVSEDGTEWGQDVCGACSVGIFTPVRQTPSSENLGVFVEPVLPEGGEQPVPSLYVKVIDNPRTVRRGDPRGLPVAFECDSDRPIIRITLNMHDDGEPTIEMAFKSDRGIDGRYVRGLAFKPTVNGTYWPKVVAYDDQGKWGEALGQTVTVTE